MCRRGSSRRMERSVVYWARRREGIEGRWCKGEREGGEHACVCVVPQTPAPRPLSLALSYFMHFFIHILKCWWGRGPRGVLCSTQARSCICCLHWSIRNARATHVFLEQVSISPLYNNISYLHGILYSYIMLQYLQQLSDSMSGICHKRNDQYFSLTVTLVKFCSTLTTLHQSALLYEWSNSFLINWKYIYHIHCYIILVFFIHVLLNMRHFPFI